MKYQRSSQLVLCVSLDGGSGSVQRLWAELNLKMKTISLQQSVLKGQDFCVLDTFVSMRE